MSLDHVVLFAIVSNSRTVFCSHPSIAAKQIILSARSVFNDTFKQVNLGHQAFGCACADHKVNWALVLSLLTHAEIRGDATPVRWSMIAQVIVVKHCFATANLAWLDLHKFLFLRSVSSVKQQGNAESDENCQSVRHRLVMAQNESTQVYLNQCRCPKMMAKSLNVTKKCCAALCLRSVPSLFNFTYF